MLFGETDVERALGKFQRKLVDARAVGHRRGNGDDLVVFLGLGDERLGEHRGIARGVALALLLFAGDDVELADAVILVGRLLRRLITVALLGHRMDQNRARRVVVTDVAQDGHQMIEVMAVDRTDIEETQLLEQRAAGGHAAGIFLGTF